MARRYARDNRGRFASTGTGATARGGRLKTAAGNKRATQTMGSATVLNSAPKGTVARGGMGARQLQKASVGSGATVAGRVGIAPTPRSSSVAARKQALVRDVSNRALAGEKISPGVRSYVKAQQEEKLRLAGGGKGNRVRRRLGRR